MIVDILQKQNFGILENYRYLIVKAVTDEISKSELIDDYPGSELCDHPRIKGQ